MNIDKSNDVIAAGNLSFNFFLFDGTDNDRLALEQWLEVNATEGLNDAEVTNLLDEILKGDLLAVVDGRMHWWRLWAIAPKNESAEELEIVRNLAPFGLDEPDVPGVQTFDIYLNELGQKLFGADERNRRAAIQTETTTDEFQGSLDLDAEPEPQLDYSEEYRHEFPETVFVGPGIGSTTIDERILEALALLDAVEAAKRSNSSVEVDGVKIAPCNAYGQTEGDLARAESLSGADRKVQLLSIVGNLEDAKKALAWVEGS